MFIIDCKTKKEAILDDVKEKIGDKKLILGVIQVQGDKASDVYVRNKKKACDQVGIECIHCKLPSDASYDDVVKIIKGFNDDNQVTGIILQLPLPPHLKQYEQKLINLINWKKDVDGLTSANVGRLWTNKSCLKPATALGIMSLLPEHLAEYNVAIINRSNLIGKPLVKMLEERNATPILCHSRTDRKFLDIVLKNSDYIITAIGQPKWLAIDKTITKVMTNNYSFVCEGIIDAGISHDEDGKLCGDVDVESFDSLGIYGTSTPNGTGLLTVAYLISNVLEAYKLQHGGLD